MQESKLLAKKNHKLYIFSSNIKRGSGQHETAQNYEKTNDIEIFRFPAKGNFGKNTYFWDYKKLALKIKPDIMLCHAYRQYYSTTALKIAKKLKIPCILVTHAPFLEKKLRNWKLNLAVFLYDTLVGKKILNKYSKIFAITKWEIPYLLRLGAKKQKIIYIPNGIPEEFFRLKKKKLKEKKPKNKTKKILFLGRIAPIKDIETLIKAFKIALEKNKNMILELVGPIEDNYGKQIIILIKKLNLEKQIKFLGPIYNLKEKIKIIDKCDVFVLPSKREAMPQSLIEAMAREKIAISSKTQGGKEIIQNNKNGYLFEIGNYEDLAEKILIAIKHNRKNQKIQKQAKKSVEQFNWKKIINKIEKIIQQETKK